MERKTAFFVQSLDKERFYSINNPMSDEELEQKRIELEQRFGGTVHLIKTPVFIYTPYTTKDG